MKLIQNMIAGLAISIAAAGPAMAQLNPGQEHIPVGGDSQATIENPSPGNFVLNQTGISAVYLNEVPTGIKVGPALKDTSSKGKAYIARLADNPELSGKALCINGVGSDWGSRACAPITGDAARVTMTFPVGTKDVTFAVVPRVYDGDRPLAWASHAKNLRHQLACPALRGGQTDMASMLRIDTEGKVRPATAAEVAAYGEHYKRFCGIEGRDVKNFSPNQ